MGHHNSQYQQQHNNYYYCTNDYITKHYYHIHCLFSHYMSTLKINLGPKFVVSLCSIEHIGSKILMIV